ncbi:MAG TPA: nitroreductase family protein [Dehalococcoidia bacterium]|nr:nitroreductase family protein [Dehalococcoidia bacterium]
MSDDSEAFQRLIRSRRSIRRYQPVPISPGVMRRILEAGTWAPSAHNRQPWRFVVLTETGEREALARAMGELLRNARLADGDDVADIEGDVARSYARIASSAAAVAAFLTMEDMDSYPDPARSRAEELMAVQGVAMAVQNILLAAHAEGIGACWMCAPLFCQEEVGSALGVPEHWKAQALITLGLPASKGKPPTRRPVDEVLLRSLT